MKNAISTEVKSFLDSKIRSVDELEILLLLRNQPDRSWDAVDVSAELRIDPISASGVLMELHLKGLLHHQEGRGRFYQFRYTKHNEDSDRSLSELALLFQRARSEVIDYITTGQRRQLQAFSDAFNSKKGK